MKFDASSPFDIQRASAYLKKLIEKGCTFEIVARKEQRTLPQNKYLHLILSYFASVYGSTLEDVKMHIFKRQVNKDIFARDFKNEFGTEVKRTRSSRDLSVEEMTLAIDRFLHWSANDAGILLPEARDFKALYFAQQEVERNKTFI